MFLELVKGDGVLDHFDDSTVWAHREHLIRGEKEGEALQLEDIVELIDELQGELFLLEVIACLDHEMDQPPGCELFVNGTLFYPLEYLLFRLPK